ncbi:hypothetical protein FB446DRAFT_759344 [Lentinula raphanica]|nr:hypothetical protein C8R42DRAFT_715059 [Lentinula raphanica]KAJ3765884.1 hypothetical protein FB446DRAFT_759344 [Lentinula raphanica]KAJ3826139.1 hypothetical protein F5880DRAFT_140276 [Lentinula raphanica]
MTRLTLRAIVLLLGAIPFGVLAAPTISTPSLKEPSTGEVQTLRQRSDLPELGVLPTVALVLRTPVRTCFINLEKQIKEIDILIVELSPRVGLAMIECDLPTKLESLLRGHPPTQYQLGIYRELLDLLNTLQPQCGSKRLTKLVAELRKEVEQLEQLEKHHQDMAKMAAQ